LTSTPGIRPAESAIPSPRGTRPRNRRAQIRTAAAALFYERGYEQVSIADVANSVNVGPSALYRHFSGKAELLYEAIDETINAFGAMVADLPSRDLRGIALTAARTALSYRPLGVLWQREARNLPAPQREALRGRLRAAIGILADTIRTIRPELSPEQAGFLAAAGVNAMSSISFHRIALPEPEFTEVLAELAERVLTYEFPAVPAPQPDPVPLTSPTSRREEISIAASSLFAQHGFDAVSLDDVGAAVGIAGPSIYNHFTSKQDLLFASMTHGYAMLAGALADALETRDAPDVVLRAISDSYVGLAFEHSDLVTVLIAESRNLSEEFDDLARRAQLGYIDQWVAVLTELRPEESVIVSRLKVQSAQMMANSLCRTVFLRDRPGFRNDVAEICWLLQQ
jgi:AcrR family transcriptional regulator